MTQFNLDAIGIPLMYVIIVSVTLWFIISGKGHWSLKGFFVGIMLYFSLAIWLSVSSLMGLPTEQPLPWKYEVLGIKVEEPIKATADPGRIYLWVKDIKAVEKKENRKIVSPEDKDRQTYAEVFNGVIIDLKGDMPQFYAESLDDQPKVHIVPYSKNLHQKAQGIKRALAQGKRIMGGKGMGKSGGKGEGGDGKGGKGKGKGKGEGKGGKQGGAGGDQGQEQDFIFHILPHSQLPSK